VPSRVSPTEQIRASIDAVFADPDLELGAAMEDVARLSVRLVFQAALEAEVTEFLGRDRYARGERARQGCRNGYSEVTVKTTAGPVELRRPKVRGTLEAFSSRLLGKGVTRTNALEALVISGWVRGLSVRDIEAALAETLGPEATVSKSTVSKICTTIGEQFDAFKRRDLSGYDLAYFYLDASHFRYHHAADAEPVLVAYGITTDGDPVLLGIDGVASESHDACAEFLRDLVARGLDAPLLTISDGGPGLYGALDRVFGDSRRQRCLVHYADLGVMPTWSVEVGLDSRSALLGGLSAPQAGGGVDGGGNVEQVEDLVLEVGEFGGEGA
jgi:putative transposase